MPSIKNELFFCHSHKTNGDNELATLSGSDYSGWEFYSQKGSSYYVYMTSSQTFYEYKKPASFIVNGVTKYQHSSANWFTSKGPRISPHY